LGQEELKAEQAAYVAAHPELTALVADFLQHLLTNKPEDCFQAAASYFSSFHQDRNAPKGNASQANAGEEGGL
jgi:hypothetical protein